MLMLKNEVIQVYCNGLTDINLKIIYSFNRPQHYFAVFHYFSNPTTIIWICSCTNMII